MPQTDEEFMRIALAEGAKGIGLTAPNPSVGAVVARGQQVLGKGYHRRAGLPHAEVEALADARSQGHALEGSDIFITLEPCSTTGRTPPCTRAIVEAGCTRVVWAADDPNPQHRGAACRILEEQGITVVRGVLQEEADYLHRAFFKVQRTGLPWVIVKTAMSLDGRITRPPGEGQWLTGWEARAEVQELRGEVDAILTSGATARADNPRLNYRGTRCEKGVEKPPLRIVVSQLAQAGLPPTAHLLSDGGGVQIVKGDLRTILQTLASEGVQSILVEAGGNLGGRLLDAELVDEWVTYLAPLVCGGPHPAVAGEGADDLAHRPRLHRVECAQLGQDLRMRGLVSYHSKGDV